MRLRAVRVPPPAGRRRRRGGGRPTSGTAGAWPAPVTLGSGAGYDVAVDSSGKLLVAGHQVQGSRGLGALLRFNADGSPDLSFDQDGVATVTPDRDGGCIRWRAVPPLPDGGTLVAGNRFLPLPVGWETRPVLARFDANGTLDTTFGGAGGGGVVVLPGTDSGGVVNDLALLSGGEILAGGYFRDQPPLYPLDFALWRLNPDGSLDITFGTDGVRRQDLGDQYWLRRCGSPSAAGRGRRSRGRRSTPP